MAEEPARDTSVLWAWMILPATGEPGGVLSMQAEPGRTVPMVSTRHEDMLAVKPFIANVARAQGYTLMLQRFTLAEVEDVVTPVLLEPESR